MAATQGSNMKHQIKRILQSSALKLILLFGLAGVNAAALAAASVTLTSPTNNTTVAAPGSFVLSATASSTDSTVKSVTFFKGTTKLKTDTSAPYTFTWSNVSAGTYNITAKVIDNKNATATSAIVTVKVVNAVPPTVSLTSPATNTVSTAPATFTLTASAASTTSTIAKIDFYRGTTLIGTSTIAPYTYTWSNVSAGTYSLTAKATDALGKTTTSTAVSVISNAPPSVSITAPANNTTLNVPANFTLSASATDSDGTVTKVEYYNGATLIGSATSFPYTLGWNNIAAGTYTITAQATDNSGAVTTSAPITLISKQAVTTTTVTASTNLINLGQATTLSATVAGNNPTGTVTFKNGATTIGTGVLAAGTTSLSYTPTTAGAHTITADYAGDNNNSGSTSAATALTVNKASSSTALTVTPNTATVGDTVAVTVAVAVTGVNPTGTVNFMEGTTTLGTVTLPAGSSSLSTTISYTATTTGSHNITAVYAGDANNAASTSVATALTVNKVVSSSALSATPNPAKPLEPLTLTATVTGTNPGGTVTFMEGANTLGTATLSNGTASFTTSFMTDGQKTLTVNYSGDSINDISTSAAVNLAVNKVTSTTTLGVTPNPAKPLEPITLTATVTGFNLTGTVNFMDGATLLGSSPVNAGVATFTTSFMDAGVRPITAVYNGDPVNTPSASFVVNMDVAKVVTTTALSITPNLARPAEPVTMTATVTGFNPSGVVSFMNGGYVMGGATVNGGVATFTTSFTATGSHVITALYGAVTVNEASYSAPVVLTINTGVAQAYFIHTDHLNTPRTITNNSGAVVWKWDNSDPFGNNSANENPTGAGAFNFNLRFPGQYFDRETNTHYNINRDYDPSTGRYVQSDPIGLEGGINTYTYVEGNPLSKIDPLGLYGTTSCAYYSQACSATGGSYVCNTAKDACPIFPPGKKGGWLQCVRQCLQEQDKRRSNNNNQCTQPREDDTPFGDHKYCFLGCAMNSQSPYNPSGPDLPDNDVQW